MRQERSQPGALQGPGRWSVLGLVMLAWTRVSLGQSVAVPRLPLLHAEAPPPTSAEQRPTLHTQPTPGASAAIQVDHDTVSVTLQDAALCDVLATIAHQSDIRVVCLDQGGESRRTIAFTAVPVAEGLRRLLAGTSYALVYAGEGPQRRLAQIFVLPGLHGETAPAAAPPASTPAAVRVAVEAHGLAEAVQAALTAATETTQGEPTPPATVTPHEAVQQMLAGQAAAHTATAQFQHLKQQLKQLLELQRQ